MIRKCGNCALKTLKGGMCPIFNAEMNDEKGCPYFASELQTCDICGNVIPKGGIVENDGDTIHLMCEQCVSRPKCEHCVHASECRFKTDRSCAEPPFIATQKRNGNMIIQSQEMNPKRIEATCAQGCSCYDPTAATCLKGTGCINHQTYWRE